MHNHHFTSHLPTPNPRNNLMAPIPILRRVSTAFATSPSTSYTSPSTPPDRHAVAPPWPAAQQQPLPAAAAAAAPFSRLVGETPRRSPPPPCLDHFHLHFRCRSHSHYHHFPPMLPRPLPLPVSSSHLHSASPVSRPATPRTCARPGIALTIRRLGRWTRTVGRAWGRGAFLPGGLGPRRCMEMIMYTWCKI